MIKQETITINEKIFMKTYSDEGYYILQNETGLEYGEAIDVFPLRYTYVETDKLIETENNEIEG